MRRGFRYLVVGLLLSHVSTVTAEDIPLGVLPSVPNGQTSSPPAVPEGQLPGRQGVTVPPKAETSSAKDLSTVEPAALQDLAVAVNNLNPELGFLKKFAATARAVKDANEFDRNDAIAREEERLRQLASDEVVILGTGEIGRYDAQSGVLPINDLRFRLEDENTDLKIDFLNEGAFSPLRMGQTEARIAVSKLAPDRKVWVKLRAKPVLAGADNQPRRSYTNSAILLVEVTEYSIAAQSGYLPDRRPGDPPRKRLWNEHLVVQAKVGNSPPPLAAIADVTDKKTQILDWEAIAILGYRADPGSFRDADYVQLMINRWLKEHRETPVQLSVDVRPAFYSQTQRLPSAAELQRYLPHFKEWVRLQAQRTSDDFYLVVDASQGRFPECNTLTTLNFNSSVRAPAVDQLLSNEEYLRLTRLAEEAQVKLFKTETEMGDAGPRLLLASSLNSDDTGKPDAFFYSHCRHPASEYIGYLKDLRSALPAGLRPGSLISAMVKIDSWTVRRNSPLGSNRVFGTVKAAIVKKTESEQVAVLVEFTPGVFEALEYRYGESTPLVVDRLNALPAALPVEPSDRRPGELTNNGQTREDIVGIKLGMQFDDARKLVEKHMPIMQELSFRSSKKNTQITPFTSGAVFIRNDLREYILLFREPSHDSAGILGISRFVYEGRNQIDAAELEAAIGQKYGTTRREEGDYVFHEASGGKSADYCHIILGGVAGNIEFQNGGSPIDTRNLVHEELRGAASDLAFLLPWAGFKPPVLQDVQKLSNCGTTATAWMPKNSGSIGGFGVWLVNMKSYGEVLQKMLNGATGGGSATKATPKL